MNILSDDIKKLIQNNFDVYNLDLIKNENPKVNNFQINILDKNNIENSSLFLLAAM